MAQEEKEVRKIKIDFGKGLKWWRGRPRKLKKRIHSGEDGGGGGQEDEE